VVHKLVRHITMSRKTGAKTGNRLGLLSPARMVGLNLWTEKRGTGRDAGVMLIRTRGRAHGRALPHYYRFCSNGSALPACCKTVYKFCSNGLGLVPACCKTVFLVLLFNTLAFAGSPPVNYAGRKMPPPATAEQIRASSSPEELAAAQGMEQMLVENMIQEMRKSVPENEFVPVSQGERIFRQMLDSEYARHMTETGTIGIADLVLAQMKGKR
jgi:hypothetical protein